MGAINLGDILVTPLKRIQTIGGDVLHGIKASDSGYCGFGEVYFSWVAKSAVKAWKRHTQMTMNLVVPVGKVRFVFCEISSGQLGEIRVEEIGEDNYARLTVPPGIFFGFQGVAGTQSLVANIASIPHDPNEVERIEQSQVSYKWG